MAITTTAIPATDLSKRALDKPCVVGRNVVDIAYTNGTSNVVANATGTLAAGDSSAAAPYGINRLSDRLLHINWKYGSAAATVYICIDQSATTVDVDTLIIANGHNLSGASIKVEADSTTPSGDPWGTTLWSFTAGSTAEVRLQAANMYKARYWRVKISGGATAWQIPDLWLGKAVQFLNKSEHPYASWASGKGGVIRQTTGGGVSYGYKTSSQTQARKQTFKVPGVYKYTAVSDPELFLSNYYDFWTNTNAVDGGTKPFWYIEDPTTSPGSAKLVYATDTDLDYIQNGPYETIFHLSTLAQGTG